MAPGHARPIHYRQLVFTGALGKVGQDEMSMHMHDHSTLLVSLASRLIFSISLIFLCVEGKQSSHDTPSSLLHTHYPLIWSG